MFKIGQILERKTLKTLTTYLKITNLSSTSVGGTVIYNGVSGVSIMNDICFSIDYVEKGQKGTIEPFTLSTLTDDRFNTLILLNRHGIEQDL